MPLTTATNDSAPRTGERLIECVARQGSGAHPYINDEALLRGPDAARNLADAVHLICTLHGRHPGVVDYAAARAVDAGARAWFDEAISAFASERTYLARLAVASGPVPSTPGASGNQAAVLAQRHALEMLAQSERNGCALGAALAVAADWVAIRKVLDAAARRFGVSSPVYLISDHDPLAALADATAGIAAERALLFGAEQIATQHFALWDLLEARQQARAAS